MSSRPGCQDARMPEHQDSSRISVSRVGGGGAEAQIASFAFPRTTTHSPTRTLTVSWAAEVSSGWVWWGRHTGMGGMPVHSG